MRISSALSLFGLVLVPTLALSGPTDPVSNGIQLAQINYSVIHNLLIDKCRETYPSSLPALSEAIDQWTSRNSEAQKKLRQLSEGSLVRNLHLSEPDAAKMAAQQSVFLTNGLKANFESVSGNDLKEACEGQYAAKSLQSPSLDFVALLAKVRKVNAKF